MNLITRSKGTTSLSSVAYTNTGELPIPVSTAEAWTKTDGDSLEVESIMREVIDVAENEFNLTIINKTVTATFGSYGNKVNLPFAPVIEIVSVEVDDEEADYTLIGNSLYFTEFGQGVLKVVYKTGGNLQEGLKLAIKKAVLSAFEDRQDTVLGGVGMIPNHSRALFKKYRNY